MSDLSCFKAYDTLGEIGVNVDEGIASRIGRAEAQIQIRLHPRAERYC